MIAFIVRRLLQATLVMLVVALLGFTMFRYVGDPVAQMVGQDTPLVERERLREELGLNDPIYLQFAAFGLIGLRANSILEATAIRRSMR